MGEGLDKFRGRSASRSHVDDSFVLVAAEGSERPGDAVDGSIGEIKWELLGLAH